MATLGVNLKPDARILRQFAVAFLLFFAGLGAWIRWKGGAPAVSAGLWGAAVLVGVAGLWKPASVRWVYLGLTFAVLPIGWTVSLVLMAVIYYGVMTPLGWTLKLLGRDVLHRGFQPDAPTYWEPRSVETDPTRYFRQF